MSQSIHLRLDGTAKHFLANHAHEPPRIGESVLWEGRRYRVVDVEHQPLPPKGGGTVTHVFICVTVVEGE